MLTIAGEKATNANEDNERHLRREYKIQSFKRSFTIDENIDTKNLDAKYVNGVLILNLPKKPEVKAPAKKITVQ